MQVYLCAYEIGTKKVCYIYVSDFLKRKISDCNLRKGNPSFEGFSLTVYYFDVDCYFNVHSLTLMIYIFTTIDLQKIGVLL